MTIDHTARLAAIEKIVKAIAKERSGLKTYWLEDLAYLLAWGRGLEEELDTMRLTVAARERPNEHIPLPENPND